MIIVFYFFFVLFIIGICLVVVIMEIMYVIIKNEEYKKLIKFWGNIMFFSFVVGVVIGII